MDLRNLSPTFWIAIGSIAGAIVAGVAVFQLISPTPFALPAVVTDPSALTAKIESFPYRHAASEFFEGTDEWREQWTKPVEEKLTARKFKPEQIEIVSAVMEEIIQEKIDRELRMHFLNITNSDRWYSVTIKNDSDVPLKGVFLKFPAANFWIDERGRLVSIPERIEIGDMDQKSEKNFTLWGKRYRPTSDNENIVLGHSNGIGLVDFE